MRLGAGWVGEHGWPGATRIVPEVAEVVPDIPRMRPRIGSVRTPTH
jgi:hypothetical protein